MSRIGQATKTVQHKRPTFVLPSSHATISLDLVLEVFALTRSIAIATTCCAENEFQSTNVPEFGAAFNIRSFHGRTLLSLLCAFGDTREACLSVLKPWDDTTEFATRYDTCSHGCCARGYPRRFTVPVLNRVVHACAKRHNCGQTLAEM